MNLDPHQLKQPSQLFTIRVWLEPLGQGQTEIRGQVQHVLSGETRYFRTWANLVAYFETRLEKGEAASLDIS
jgi:hypothetical protein